MAVVGISEVARQQAVEGVLETGASDSVAGVGDLASLAAVVEMDRAAEEGGGLAGESGGRAGLGFQDLFGVADEVAQALLRVEIQGVVGFEPIGHDKAVEV